jgi:hypothetical protein
MTTGNNATKVCKPWTEVVTEKRAIRDAQIDKHSKADIKLPSDGFSFKTVDVEVLKSLLRDGKVSAVQVIHAYIRRQVHVTVPNSSMLTVTLELARRRNR